MRYSNIHTHTTFSDGRHSVDENIQSAIDLNMLSLGFSDHSYTAFDTSYCMKENAIPDYLSIIEHGKEKYGDAITLFSGIELDYYSHIDTSLFDFVIASVHYINRQENVFPLDFSADTQKACIDQLFAGNMIDFAKCYFDMVVAHVEKVRPQLVGHFDLIDKFGLMPVDSEEYRKIATQALTEVIKLCPYIEMNTGAISRGYRQTPYPAPFLLDCICSQGGKIVLGSDSHDKHNLTFFFDECIDILQNHGFHEISVFNGEQFISQKI